MVPRLLAIVCVLLSAPALASGAGRNLVANPGFEDGLTGWTTGHAWYESPKGSGVSASAIDRAVAHSGQCSLRIDGKGNRGIVMQAFAVRPGKYHLSGWVRTQGLGGASASVLAEWMSRDGGKWLAGSPVGAVSGDSDWRLVEGDVEAPAEARWVHLDVLTSAANSGAAWFDDVALTRIPAAAAPPGPVRFTVASPPGRSGELRLDWSGHTPEADVLQYRVYCSPTPFTATRGLQPALTVDGDARSATLAGLANGRTYHVAVVAANVERLALDVVASRAASPRDRQAPRAPVVTVRPLASGARVWPAALVSWTVSPGDDDIARFRLDDGHAVLACPPAAARSVLLKRLPKPNATIMVVAIDRAGNESQPGHAQLLCPKPGTGPAALSGIVRDGGTPVPGATVQVRRVGRIVRTLAAGPGGCYRTQSLPDGVYVVQAVAGWGPASRPAYVMIGGGPVNADLEMPPSRAWAAWVATPVSQIFRDTEAPSAPSTRIALTSMANQRRSAQVAIRPVRDLQIEGVRFEPLVSADGLRSIPAGSLAYNFVSYCSLSKNSTAMPPEELVRRAPAEFPDELSDDVSRHVRANQTQPIFLTVSVPKGTKAATYTGRAFVQTPLGEQPFGIQVRVLPLQFPDRTRLFVVNWLDWGAIARKHGVPVWSDAFFDVARIYTKLMREHHQNVVVIPPELCRIWVEPDRSVTYDWSLFDRAAQFFIDEGVGERLCVGHLGGRTTGEWECPTFSLWPRPATVRATGESASVAPEEFAAALQAHVEKRGWLERTLQHVGDEPTAVNVQSYREQSARVHRAAPKLRRIDAIHVPDLKGSLEVWVPELEYFDRWYGGYRQFQRAGDAELWFYIAWVPQGRYPQRLIDTQAVKARTIHWMNYLWGTSGYLHWALEWWDIDVESLAPGDSRIIWPGRDGPNSSLRYEAQREGLEDCEILAMLEDAYRGAARQLGADGFDAASRSRELGHSVVRTLTDYTRSYEDLEAIRTQMTEEIIGVRRGPALLTKVSQTADKPIGAGGIAVEGWAESGSAVTVNGQAVPVTGGRFQTTVSVSAAHPTIVVRASKGGRSVEVVRRYRVEQ